MNKKELKKKNKLEQSRWRKMSLEEVIAELGKHHKRKKRFRKKEFQAKSSYSSVDLEGASNGSSKIIYTPMGNKR